MSIALLQDTIEFLAQKKIRRGFQKFIPETMEYFNIVKLSLNKDNCLEIVKFINSSNSKLSIAYWILRKDYTKEQSQEIVLKYNKEFVESSYKYTTRAQTNKKFFKNNGRGYQGYVTIDGLEKYCRSSNEFIMWHTLSEKYGINNIKYEHCAFNINDKFNYKPDFFIYDNNILIKIIEAKDPKFIVTEQYTEIKKFFKRLKINYEIVTDSKTNITKDLKLKLEEWKVSDRVTGGNKGILNSRYGVIVLDSTRKKISDATIKRCEDPLYREKLSKAQKQRYIDDPTLYEKSKEMAKLRWQNMSDETKKLKAENFSKNFKEKHYHTILCIGNCGTELYLNKNKESICKECRRKRTKAEIPSKTGKSSIESFINIWIKETSLDFVLDKLKETTEDNINFILLKRKQEINRLNSKIGIKSIKKYYNTIQNLIDVIKEQHDSRNN